MAKPPLIVIGPGSNTISPPRKLGQHGMDLWNAVMAEFHIEDRGGLELLAQACAAADRVERLAERIDADGEVINTRAGPKAHPALRDELAARSFIVRTLQRLGITDEAIRPVGRPSGSAWRGREGAD